MAAAAGVPIVPAHIVVARPATTTRPARDFSRRQAPLVAGRDASGWEALCLIALSSSRRVPKLKRAAGRPRGAGGRRRRLGLSAPLLLVPAQFVDRRRAGARKRAQVDRV